MNKSLYENKLPKSVTLSKLIKWCVGKYLSMLADGYVSQGKKQFVGYTYDLVTRDIDLYGTYNGCELHALIDWLRISLPNVFEGDYIDVGANIGNHSIFFSEFHPLVHAFEPCRKTYEILVMNSRLVENVICYNEALSDQNGPVSFVEPVGYMGCSSIVGQSSEDTKSVMARKLDSLIDRFKGVGILKIDVEGHEYNVLSGASEVIKRYRPIIMFEQHISDFDANGKSRVVELLRAMGYDRFVAVREYPRVSNNNRKMLDYIYMLTMRVLLGSRIRVELMSNIEPEFYPFLVAIPCETVLCGS